MLNGYKTYLACVSAFLIAVAGTINQFVAGQPIEYQYIIDSLLAIALLFLRKGIKTTA